MTYLQKSTIRVELKNHFTPFLNLQSTDVAKVDILCFH